jgi:carbamoyl-phosphate synthase large subunit
MVGYNEPEVLINKHLLGIEPEKYFSYNEGLILRGLTETLIKTK